MSDLGRTTIVNITSEYCDVKYEQYVREVVVVLNDELKTNESKLKATVLVFLQDLIAFGYPDKKAETPLAHYNADTNDILVEQWYEEEMAERVISKAEILEWTIQPPDFTDEDVKAEYDDNLKNYTPEEAAYLCSKTFIVVRIYFHNPSSLKGLEVGMDESTTLDTWVCDWL